MLKALAIFAAGLWVGNRLTSTAASGEPEWWHPAMIRLFAADQVPQGVPADLLTKAEAAARAAGIPIGWVIEASKQGASDLVAAALDMREAALQAGAPQEQSAALWRSQVISAWR